MIKLLSRNPTVLCTVTPSTEKFNLSLHDALSIWAELSDPVDIFLLPDLEQQFQFFLEQGIVIIQVISKKRIGLHGGTPAHHQFGPALGYQVQGGIALEDPHRIGCAEHGDRGAQSNV